MNWNIRNDAPVYTQLVDQIKILYFCHKISFHGKK